MVASGFVGAKRTTTGSGGQTLSIHSVRHRASPQKILGVHACMSKVQGMLKSPVRFPNPFQHLYSPYLIFIVPKSHSREFWPLGLTQHTA